GSLELYAAEKRSTTAFASSAGPATAMAGDIKISPTNKSQAGCVIFASRGIGAAPMISLLI
ncbi:MAG TPA: hypothetical protein VLG72_00185, partial [Nitrospirota bacterium]|nr:hypothetical protein [Nitrospirota bacterium]